MMRVPLAGACVDVLFSIDSLQFAADPDQVLAEIARVVKPGGTLILSIQNYTNPAGIKKRLVERFTGRTWSPWLVHPYDHGLTYR
jgi:2-polyprenyl-6-hydroxyphenyl methylase/3-demethylubiquinone-9 3-methyltransferase